MKKLFLFLSVLWSLSASAQFGPAGTGVVASSVVPYVNIPDAPTLSSPITIIPSQECCGGGIYNQTLVGAAPKDANPSGNFSSGFSVRIWDGTDATHAYRIVNTSGTDIFGAPAGAQHGFSSTVTADWISVYGKSATEPFVVKGSNGFQLPHAPIASGGGNWSVVNAVAKSPAASGLTANFGISGTAYYENMTERYFRSFSAGQEGICYYGNTGASYDGTNYLNIVNCDNNYSWTSSRESTQFEHINTLTAHHNTGYLPGQTGGAGQDNSLQAHDLGPGSTISYSIYSGSPTPFNIFSHNVTISYTYFDFSTNYGFIGRTDNSYFSTSTRLTGGTVTFDHCWFKYTGGGSIAKLCQIEERVANIVFTNCTFENITTIYLDNRLAGFTNTITGAFGSGGNVSVSSGTIAPLSFITGYNDPDDYGRQGRLQKGFWYTQHMGFLTPP